MTAGGWHGRRNRLLLFAVAAAAAWWLALADTRLWFSSFPRVPDPADFSLYYAAAQIGLAHGWSHIYDLGLQRAEFFLFHPPHDVFDDQVIYVTPPPMAWFVALLTPLGYGPAFWTWVAISAAAYAAAALAASPGDPLQRATLMLVGATTYPLLSALQNGQVAVAVAMAVVLAWSLLTRGHPAWAGLALGALFLKPQVAHLVPLCLLMAGRWRPAVVAAAVAAVALVASVLVLGVGGTQEWRAALSVENANRDNQIWTPALLVGPGLLAYAIEIAGGALALVTAWLGRASLELVMAVGLAGSLVAAPYHHGSDAVVLLPATFLYLRTAPPRWHWPWIAYGAVAAFMTAPWGPRPLLVYSLGLLVLLAERGLAIRGARRTAPA